MNPSQAMVHLKLRYKKALDETVADMFNELIHITPVKTGQLKTSWSLNPKGDGWLLSNNMEYASIIFDGRRIIAGKAYGSDQLPAGLDPVIAKYNIILENKFKRITV